LRRFAFGAETPSVNLACNPDRKSILQSFHRRDETKEKGT
jgi:hypothetical protein